MLTPKRRCSNINYMTHRSDLYRVQDLDFNFLLDKDGYTLLLPYLAACTLANRINGRVVK